MARTGRRPGDGDTRGEILAAARAQFGHRGFHAATIRGIADHAGVDPALIHHYFGSKVDLFAASADLPMRPDDLADHVFGPGLDGAGERVARMFFLVWEEPTSRDGLLTLLRGAFTNDHGAAALREFFGEVLVDRGAAAMDRPDAQLRLTLVASHLIGVAVLRYVVGFPAIVEASVDELVGLVAPRLQEHMTG